MKKIIISTIAISALLFSVGCQTDFDRDVSDVPVTSGSASFANYISLGNSLTSGFRDGALYIDGQNESYPSIIAKQMQLAGGGSFVQPMMPNNIGGFTSLYQATGKTQFYGKLMLNPSLLPEASTPTADLDIIGGAGKYFNNMGVPGAKSFHLITPGYGSAANIPTQKANPYFVRFATSATTSVLLDAVAQVTNNKTVKKQETFFSLWIGANDVLSYATSGGMGVDRKGNVDPSTYGGNDISDPNVVAGSIKQILEGMKAAGATKGVIANIPYVTSIPYFTTVPYDPFTGKITTDTAAQLMSAQAYGKYNAGLGQALAGKLISQAEYQQRLINFTAGKTAVNGAVIVDKDLTDLSALGIPSLRQTTSNDLILLPALSLLRDQTNAKGGTANPLADGLVLTATEAAKVKAAVDAYNTSIAGLATSYGLALVDANAAMLQLNSISGIKYDGVTYNAKFISGGAFSLDGVHPTGRGYGVIANEFIKAINNKYFSTLPLVNPNNYSGITFPAN